MATTSLWKFKSRLKGLINYVTNEEKTNDKLFVSGINCLPNIAYQEMINTKKQFFKTGGIECFHGYQSFVSGEVTPNQAHEIGIKLAKELWGDKYQVIVATHINTDNIHNHFVLNSVSFVDGKRFNNNNRDYKKMRITSDKLCEEYGLNVLPKKYEYTKYATNNLYKELMKDSIDYAIENAENFDDFLSILKNIDYDITVRNGEVSMKKEPYKRNTRILKSFGNMYSIENIRKRILETQPLFTYSPQAYLTTRNGLIFYNTAKNKLNSQSDFQRLILYYEKLFIGNIENVSKSNITKYTPELIRDIKKMNEYSKQAIFLATNSINTEKDLIKYEKEVYSKISPLKSERENLWRKHKRAKTDEDKLNIENEIAEISKQIYPLTEDCRLCNDVLNRMRQFKEEEIKIKIIEEKEQAEKKFFQKKKNNKIR